MIMWFKQQTESSYLRAMDWFRNHFIAGQGIIVHTKKPVPYPEVTGYFIPTLYHWNEKDYARTCTRWLMSVQLEDGAFAASDGIAYTFDTGQVLRGLCAASGDVPGAEDAARKAADWILRQIRPDGSVTTPSTELWGDIANDLIHTYVLPPLLQAGKLFGSKEYVDAARFALEYYKQQAELVPFNRLSHFHAYAMEALYEMGELDLCARGMANAAAKQRRDGGVPGYPDVDWVCSTGLAQYAVVWQRLGEYKRADRAIRYLEKIQNPGGGFNGSYGKNASYIPGAEISWAVKYFLDAWELKLAREQTA
jgi:malonyl-CoA O-methyltransferase